MAPLQLLCKSHKSSEDTLGTLWGPWGAGGEETSNILHAG